MRIALTTLPAFGGMFLQGRKFELADLYEEPFTNFGANAVEKMFSESEITELIELIERLAA